VSKANGVKFSGAKLSPANAEHALAKAYMDLADPLKNIAFKQHLHFL